MPNLTATASKTGWTFRDTKQLTPEQIAENQKKQAQRTDYIKSLQRRRIEHYQQVNSVNSQMRHNMLNKKVNNQ